MRNLQTSHRHLERPLLLLNQEGDWRTTRWVDRWTLISISKPFMEEVPSSVHLPFEIPPA